MISSNMLIAYQFSWPPTAFDNVIYILSFIDSYHFPQEEQHHPAAMKNTIKLSELSK